MFLFGICLAAAPSSPPQNLVLDQVTATSVELSWEPPLPNTHNGVIGSYTVRVVETGSNLVVQIHQDVTSTSITLTGLHPAYDYSVSVAALTVALSPFSSITVTTLEAGEPLMASSISSTKKSAISFLFSS